MDEDNTEDVNEAMTALVVAGENHPFSALLGSGMSEKQGDNFLDTARDELMEIRAKIEAVLDVFETETERDAQVRLLWGTVDTTEEARSTNVVEALEDAFGTIPGFYSDDDNTTLDTEATPDDNDALSKIDDLIMALSSVDGLAKALEDDGALNDLEVPDGGKTAAQIFDAAESETSVSYGVTGMTRYGAVAKTARTNAVSDADLSHADGELGGYSFGVTDDTVRRWHVASAGNAYYDGGTLAVDQDGTHYSGNISIRVRFATNRVDRPDHGLGVGRRGGVGPRVRRRVEHQPADRGPECQRELWRCH